MSQEKSEWTVMREKAIHLAGYLEGLSRSDRHDLESEDREKLRESSAMIARSIGRPDLAPSPVGITP